MREIVSEVPNADSVTFMFDDSSVVWVVFQKGSVVNSTTYKIARSAARNFFDPKVGRNGCCDISKGAGANPHLH